MWCNGSTLAQNARDVCSIPTLGTIFPIFITPMTSLMKRHCLRNEAFYWRLLVLEGSFWRKGESSTGDGGYLRTHCINISVINAGVWDGVRHGTCLTPINCINKCDISLTTPSHAN